MSCELACQLSSRIAAIASVSGGLVTSWVNACAPQHPTPVLEIHGTADSTVYYNGGGTKTNFFSTPHVLAYWAGLNGCASTPVVTPLPNTSTLERGAWSGGRYGSTVVHYKVIGGDRTWPGASGGDAQDSNASVENVSKLTTGLPMIRVSSQQRVLTARLQKINRALKQRRWAERAGEDTHSLQF